MISCTKQFNNNRLPLENISLFCFTSTTWQAMMGFLLASSGLSWLFHFRWGPSVHHHLNWHPNHLITETTPLQGTLCFHLSFRSERLSGEVRENHAFTTWGNLLNILSDSETVWKAWSQVWSETKLFWKLTMLKTLTFTKTQLSIGCAALALQVRDPTAKGAWRAVYQKKTGCITSCTASCEFEFCCNFGSSFAVMGGFLCSKLRMKNHCFCTLRAKHL